MTLKEAIKALHYIRESFALDVDSYEALDMGIKALKRGLENSTTDEKSQLSGENSTCDLIKRQDAIDALKEKVFRNLSDEFYGAMQVMDELPSADVIPKPKALDLPDYTWTEIVRCKDCEYYMPQQESTGLCTWFSDVLKYGVSVIDFCSNGKKAGDSNG